MKKKAILFLHLSDIHLCSIDDINEEHLNKIIDSLKCYKNIEFKNICIVISGDLTYSGTLDEFKCVGKMIGLLIRKIQMEFKCKPIILAVPGNHDVDHSNNELNVQIIKDGKYPEYEKEEFEKQINFHKFASFNNCFTKHNDYYDIKFLNIGNLKIRVNLINNAIFSTKDQYKGLLYLPDSSIEEISKIDDSSINITIMHHAPDYYRDEIKNKIEDNIIKNTNILFHGHEHYNYSKNTSFEGSNATIIQSCGCLCDKGDWSNSSYMVGVLDIDSLNYDFQKFVWNSEYKQYQHTNMIENIITPPKIALDISEDFQSFIKFSGEDYYVFPTIVYHGDDSSNDYQISSFETFKNELLQYRYSSIVGTGNVGKTALLKNLFKSFYKNYYILYCSPELLINKSANKRQNIDKLIKALFEDIYGHDESKWQSFEQSDIEDCIFMLDDFEQIDGLNMNAFFQALSSRFGTIIISNTRTIDFNPYNINIEEIDTIAKFEIKPPVGQKRREIISAVVRKKADDKSSNNIETIVLQIDKLIKTQLNIIPPEPYYIIQMAESYMNNVGEAIYKRSNSFSKVFESNLTNKIDGALRSRSRKNDITVELMYVIFGKIAFYIHFNKAYPIKRREIESIIDSYNEDYGKKLETEDFISIAKDAKIISNTENSKETFRFKNKSILAYFVAKEIIARNDMDALRSIVEKACINICTDILLFIIYLTDNTKILSDIIEYVNTLVSLDEVWNEFLIPDKMPAFLSNNNGVKISNNSVSLKGEKQNIEHNEEKAEESMIKEFVIKDIYDWDDSEIETVNNKLFRMTSLLQIIAKSLPCFEHILKKNEKQTLLKLIYSLPNRIFMYWSVLVENNFEDVLSELKNHPYLATQKTKLRAEEIDKKVRESFAQYSIRLLLTLYYIPVLNASGYNTFSYLNDIDFFDYTQTPTYLLEHLMFLEQMTENNDFVTEALRLQKINDDNIVSCLLSCIVRHGLITRKDTKNDIDRLESKFFAGQNKPFLIERTKEFVSKK